MGSEDTTTVSREILANLWNDLERLARRAGETELPDFFLTLMTLRAALERTDPQSWDSLRNASAPEQADLLSTVPNGVLRRPIPADKASHQDHMPPVVVAELISLASDSRLGEGPAATVPFSHAYQFFLDQTAQNALPDFLGHPPPESVRALIAELLRPVHGSVYDPCARSGQLLSQLDDYHQARGRQDERLRLFGQENDAARWRQAHEQASVRDTTIDLGSGPLDEIFGPYLDDGNGPGGWWFRQEIHPDLQCDYAVSYPPASFIDSGLEYVMLDPRWEFGPGIPDPADFAWLQLAIHHLLPGGAAAVVLSAETLSSEDWELTRVRKNLISAGVVRCIIDLPTDPCAGDGAPTALWVCQRHRPTECPSDSESRAQEVLLLDLSTIGSSDEEGVGLNDAVFLRGVADLYHRSESPLPRTVTQALAAVSTRVSIAELLDREGVLVPSQWL